MPHQEPYISRKTSNRSKWLFNQSTKSRPMSAHISSHPGYPLTRFHFRLKPDLQKTLQIKFRSLDSINSVPSSKFPSNSKYSKKLNPFSSLQSENRYSMFNNRKYANWHFFKLNSRLLISENNLKKWFKTKKTLLYKLKFNI